MYRESPSDGPRAAFTLCFWGLVLAVLSYLHYANSRDAHAFYEFSQRHPGLLVPVSCGNAPGKENSDFIRAAGDTTFPPIRNSGKPSYVNACWYPSDRYARFFVQDGSVAEAADRQYEALSLKRPELKAVKAQSWSLLGIPIGIFIFAVGASVPFLRQRPATGPDKQTGERASVDPAVLRDELSRLRHKLKT